MPTSGKIGHNYSPLLYTLLVVSFKHETTGKQLSRAYSNSVIVVKECPPKFSKPIKFWHYSQKSIGKKNIHLPNSTIMMNHTYHLIVTRLYKVIDASMCLISKSNRSVSASTVFENCYVV